MSFAPSSSRSLRRLSLVLSTLLLAAALSPVTAQDDSKKRRKGKSNQEQEASSPEKTLTTATLQGLSFRAIGPALPSGRIVDLAVQEDDPKIFYVATASGGLWKTTNAATTFEPIFDREASYSLGCVVIDPQDPLVIWAGSGENNSQRSVAYGDGVYKSVDGGKSWKNVGLPESEHIGMIAIDPRNSDRVLVAAQGPLWREGGDRGLYATEDGGATWERILEIDEHTGVSEIHFDPRDPDTLYAVAYQRARRVWTLIDGGPGSGIHKSTDGGKTWSKLSRGLPNGDVGRIGLAIATQRPTTIYAIVEASREGSGVYRSLDAGASWQKRSGYLSSSPQYYQELVADPHDPDRVYSMDTFLSVTEDGGKTWTQVGQEFKHVDEHALWIDPQDPDHLRSGNDGGFYESWDRGLTWRFSGNLSLAQFYKLAVDNDVPFYNVYGGTQDNNTLGGPSQTSNVHGITNQDWFVTVGGDGFQPRIDPEDPNIVYSQWQHGNLIRYDRRTGEQTDIKPREAPGDEPLVWNWDSPLIISPFKRERLYFGAQKLFRSDDRGDSWTTISPDLTRQLDRNELEVMGRVWEPDAIAKHVSTSIYGNLVALSESPVVEGLLYVGSDDGLIHVLEPGGDPLTVAEDGWRPVEPPNGVERLAYVARVEASAHDADTVYAVYNNHKSGDFKPYVVRSRDRGRSWESIASDLPERGSAWAIVEDPVDPDLLFVGTEFGVFATIDGGGSWVQLKAGIPTISVRDLAIQAREVDLVAGTFGRGFYVLDDYSALRSLSQEDLESDEPQLLSVSDAWLYNPSSPLGGFGNAFLGHSFFAAENPPFGATATVYLKEPPKTKKQQRAESEREARKAEKEASSDDDGDSSSTDSTYPTMEALRAETLELAPKVVLDVFASDGTLIRSIQSAPRKGMQRLTWDLRHPAVSPISAGGGRRFGGPPRGPLVAPGTYSMTLALEVDGERTASAEPVSFEVTPLVAATLEAPDRVQLAAFHAKVARLARAAMGASRTLSEARSQLEQLTKAIALAPGAEPELGERARALGERARLLGIELNGDSFVARRGEPTPPSISNRVRTLQSTWSSTAPITQTQRDGYDAAATALEDVLSQLRAIVEQDLETLKDDAEAAGAPWSPGRIPTFVRE